MILIIARGLPGSGKSTAVRNLELPEGTYQDHSLTIHSTDDYWGPDYNFDIKKIKQAHQWNFDNFVESVKQKKRFIVIDNTNVCLNDFLRYVIFAIRRGYLLYLLEPDTEWRYNVEECYKRNTHNVPLDTIKKMAGRWQTTGNIVKTLGTEDDQTECSRLLNKE